MSLDLITIVENDDLPELYVQIIDEVTGSPIDLSDTRNVVTQKFRAKGTDTVLFSRVMTKKETDNGATGIVIWGWDTDSLDDLTPGRYEGEISISFNGLIQTIVDKIPFKLIADF